jgi:hypothetical protein
VARAFFGVALDGIGERCFPPRSEAESPNEKDPNGHRGHFAYEASHSILWNAPVEGISEEYAKC